MKKGLLFIFLSLPLLMNAQSFISTGGLIHSSENDNSLVRTQPVVRGFEIFQYLQGQGEYTLRALVDDEDAICTWQSDGVISDIRYPYDASFLAHPNLFKEVAFPVLSYQSHHYVTLTASNQFGSGLPFTGTFSLITTSPLPNGLVTVTNNTMHKESMVMSIYPNPVKSGVVTVDLKKVGTIDFSGQTVRSDNFSETGTCKFLLWSEKGLIRSWESNSADTQISVDDLTAGIYFIHIVKDGRIYKQKLIKK